MNRAGAWALGGSLIVHGGVLLGLVQMRAAGAGVARSAEVVPVEIWERRSSPSRPFDRPRGDRSHRSRDPLGQQPGARSTPLSGSHSAHLARHRPQPERQAARDHPAFEAPDLSLPERLQPDLDPGPPIAGMALGLNPGGTTAKGGAAEPPGPTDGPPDPALLAELHRRLSVAARRCYPAAARAFRLRGSSPLRFCLDGEGNAGAVSLLGTTGSPLLDRAATDCVIPGALPLPGTGCYTVRIDFTGP